MRQVSRLPSPPVPGTLLKASVSDLVKDVNQWSAKIETLQAVVQFQATALLTQEGLEKQYHQIRAYILLKKPSLIRIQGEAPVVGTEIFDMTSNGSEFRLSIPPKNQFITGADNYHATKSGGLENLRPRHILEALLVAPLGPTDNYFVEETNRNGQDYYVLTVVKPAENHTLKLVRKIWFDRTDLRVKRSEIFGADGKLEEAVNYSGYGDFQGISYPSHIKLSRPVEGYALGIQFERATFNEEIGPEKFVLPRPPHAKLIRLGQSSGGNSQ